MRYPKYSPMTRSSCVRFGSVSGRRAFALISVSPPLTVAMNPVASTDATIADWQLNRTSCPRPANAWATGRSGRK